MTNQATAGTPTCDCKLWDILVESAKERTTIRYSKLARQAGLEQCQDELRTLLQRIRMYCTENHLPILSAIVMDDVGKYAASPPACRMPPGSGHGSSITSGPPCTECRPLNPERAHTSRRVLVFGPHRFFPGPRPGVCPCEAPCPLSSYPARRAA